VDCTPRNDRSSRLANSRRHRLRRFRDRLLRHASQVQAGPSTAGEEGQRARQHWKHLRQTRLKQRRLFRQKEPQR